MNEELKKLQLAMLASGLLILGSGVLVGVVFWLINQIDMLPILVIPAGLGGGCLLSIIFIEIFKIK